MRFYEAVGALWSCQVLGPDLVRLAIATGNAEVAASVVARIEAMSESMRTHTATGAALRCHGLVDDDSDLLLASVAAYRSRADPYELAVTAEDAAVAAGSARASEGSGLLGPRRASGYERLGAAHCAARAAAISGGRAASRPAWTTPTRRHRVAQSDGERAQHRRARRRGPHESRDRTRLFVSPPHGGDPPPPRLRQARALVPGGRRPEA